LSRFYLILPALFFQAADAVWRSAIAHGGRTPKRGKRGSRRSGKSEAVSEALKKARAQVYAEQDARKKLLDERAARLKMRGRSTELCRGQRADSEGLGEALKSCILR